MAKAKKAAPSDQAPVEPTKPTEAEQLETICLLVAEGQTIRQVAAALQCSPGHVIQIVNRSGDEGQKQYARARDAAADLFEADIYTAAEACTPESAPADRVKIDALKWIAARRAPKRYGDRVMQEIANPEGQVFKTESTVSLSPDEAYKRMLNASHDRH